MRMFRIWSLLIGYGFGNILTAELVTRKYRKMSVFNIGTGNPGMANVMAQCGFVPGVLCLAGDLAKTVAACVLCRFVLTDGSLLAAAWAGLGVCLGHNFPFWHHFRGGKGVATTCAAIFCIRPLWGLIAMCAGMLTVFATGYLSIGAVCIPLADLFILAALYHSTELNILMLLMTLLMFSRHYQGLRRIPSGTEPKVPVPRLLTEKFGRYTLPVICAGMLIVLFFAILGSI